MKLTLAAAAVLTATAQGVRLGEEDHALAFAQAGVDHIWEQYGFAEEHADTKEELLNWLKRYKFWAQEHEQENEDFVCGGLCIALAPVAATAALKALGLSQTTEAAADKSEFIHSFLRMFGLAEEGEEFICGGLCMGLAPVVAGWALNKFGGAETDVADKEKFLSWLSKFLPFSETGEPTEDQEKFWNILRKFMPFSETGETTEDKEKFWGVLPHFLPFSETGDEFICGGLCMGLAPVVAGWALNKFGGAETDDND